MGERHSHSQRVEQPNRRQVLKASGGLGAASILAGCTNVISGGGGGGEFPNQPIHSIIPFSQGGGTDIYTRQIWSKASEMGGFNVQFENVPGAAGMRGAAQLYNSEPNGYTMASLNTPEVVTSLIQQTDFKLSEFDAICSYARTTFVIIANPEYGIENFDDLVHRYRNDEITTIGGQTEGSPQWVVSFILKNNEEFNMPWEEYVPYTGSGGIKRAVASNEVPVGITSENAALSVAESDEVDLVAALSSEGSSVFPELESIVEYGYPKIDYAGQFNRGFFAPPDTPDDRIETLSGLAKEAIQSDELQQWSEETGNSLNYRGPDYLGNLVEQKYERTPKVIPLKELRD